MDESAEFSARLARAHELALSLVGLHRDEAEEVAVREGCVRSQVITPDIHAVTADLDPYRIRLFVDEAGTVVRATGG
jgi:hypothetical protein